MPAASLPRKVEPRSGEEPESVLPDDTQSFQRRWPKAVKGDDGNARPELRSNGSNFDTRRVTHMQDTRCTPHKGVQPETTSRPITAHNESDERSFNNSLLTP